MGKHLLKLPPFGDDGAVHMVVEAPRGSSLKIKLEPELGAFTVSKALPTGLTYPYDWGFIPGTIAEDGDPLDSLALHEHASYPGLVLPCRLLGLLELEENGHDGKRQHNDRILVIPTSNERLSEVKEANDLPKRLREEIEQFFLNTAFHTAKNPKCLGWRSSRHAEALVKKAARKARRRG